MLQNPGQLSYGLLILLSSQFCWAAEPVKSTASRSRLVEPRLDEASALSAESMHAESRNLGSQSCSSTSCHGDPDRTSLLASAAQFYFDRDPHTQAGLVLYDELSSQMTRRLGLGAAPWEVKVCQDCHAPGAHVARNSRASLSRKIAEGVGCEACHGAAQDWLAVHHTRGWKNPAVWNVERKAAAGYIETKQFATRAKLCADCHVGNASQQVTHDLIAAGHPRLTYEFTAYHDALPAHWNRRADQQRLSQGRPAGDFQAQAWTIGQLMNAERQVDQLLAGLESSTSPHIDLAHYDCFACHHDLSEPSWRQHRASTTLAPGQAAWGSWTLSLLPDFADDVDFLDGESLQDPTRQLQQLMQNYSNDRETLTRHARQLQQNLRSAAMVVSQGDVVERESLFSAFVARVESAELPNMGWDARVQLYLGLAALHSVNTKVAARHRSQLLAIRDRLAYSHNAWSPVQEKAGTQRGSAEISSRDELDRLFREYISSITMPAAEPAVD